MNNNGFDKYLEYQFQQTGHFFTQLFDLISRADEDNLVKLAKGFPQEVEAYKTWTRKGVDEFRKSVSAGHPLLQRLDSE